LDSYNNINSEDSEDDEPVVPPYLALEKQVYENIKASILGTDETLWAQMAHDAIKREQARQQSIPFGPIAPIITPAPSNTQNSATVAAVKIQSERRGQIASKFQNAGLAKAEWHALTGERQNKSQMRRAHFKL